MLESIHFAFEVLTPWMPLSISSRKSYGSILPVYVQLLSKIAYCYYLLYIEHNVGSVI